MLISNREIERLVNRTRLNGLIRGFLMEVSHEMTLTEVIYYLISQHSVVMSTENNMHNLDSRPCNDSHLIIVDNSNYNNFMLRGVILGEIYPYLSSIHDDEDTISLLGRDLRESIGGLLYSIYEWCVNYENRRNRNSLSYIVLNLHDEGIFVRSYYLEILNNGYSQ